MISMIISYIMNRCRAEKPMQAQSTAMHTIIIRERSAWTCIFSSLPVWMSFQECLKSCVQMMYRLCQHRHGSSIRIANPTRLSAGCLLNWLRGSVRILDRSCSFPPSVTWSGVWGS